MAIVVEFWACVGGGDNLDHKFGGAIENVMLQGLLRAAVLDQADIGGPFVVGGSHSERALRQNAMGAKQSHEDLFKALLEEFVNPFWKTHLDKLSTVEFPDTTFR
jgi:hypothetical protein